MKSELVHMGFQLVILYPGGGGVSHTNMDRDVCSYLLEVKLLDSGTA